MFERKQKIEQLHLALEKSVINKNPFLQETPTDHIHQMKNLTESLFPSLSAIEREKILHEIHGLGPIESLILDSSVSEILIHSPEEISYESHGTLYKHPEIFSTEQTFNNFIHRISGLANIHVNIEKPYATGDWQDFRIQMIGPALSKKFTLISLRRMPKQTWTLPHLLELKWCTEEQLQLLRRIYQERKNFLIIGPTGSGKTAVMNALLQESRDSHERILTLEDVAELEKPNTFSSSLYTREDHTGVLTSVSLSELVKLSLRLRPDRLVLGEVRGGEAKDLLMALSTGHRGSFGSLHADDPRQALLRLEMLIQQGAPEWSTESIRTLIHLGLDYLILVGKNKNGFRECRGLFKITSRESHGFLIDEISQAN